MKIDEMRKRTSAELVNELHALLREQFNLRMQRGSGHKIKPHLFASVRKNIARIKTLLGEKGQNAEEGQSS